MIRLVGLLALCLVAFSAQADDQRLSDPKQEAIAHALMKEIRCLVCQNQSIEDSNADLAVDLRNIVREHIGAGESPEQVKTYLVDRYGDWVLLKPPVRSDTYFLWGSPVLILIAIFILVMVSRKKQPMPSALTAQEKTKLDKLLKGSDE